MTIQNRASNCDNHSHDRIRWSKSASRSPSQRIKCGRAWPLLAAIALQISSIATHTYLRADLYITHQKDLDAILPIEHQQQQLHSNNESLLMEEEEEEDDSSNEEDLQALRDHIRKNTGIFTADGDDILDSIFGDNPPFGWSVFESYFGNEAIIHGENRHCSSFQAKVAPKDRTIAIAGMFNSGTNLLYHLLNTNCIMPRTEEHVPTDDNNKNNSTPIMLDETLNGIEWMVPWGKHVLANRWDSRITENSERINKDHTLTVVTVRDPYEWMSSMCQHPYMVKWEHEMNLTKKERNKRTRLRNKQAAIFETTGGTNPSSSQQQQQQQQEDTILPPCPMLTYFPTNNKSKIPVYVHEDAGGSPTRFDSTLDYWNEWHRQYWQLFVKSDDRSSLMIRLEDLVLRPKDTVNSICSCAGGQLLNNNALQFPTSSVKPANGHGPERTGVLEAWRNLARRIRRPRNGLLEHDYEMAKATLDRMLMKQFGYHQF